MLRIHFTAEDIARTRIAQRPDTMWELVNSLQMLQERKPPMVFKAWRHDVGQRLDPSVRLLLPLAPPADYFPDFLTPAEGVLGFEPALDAVVSTPKTRLRAEIANLSRRVAVPSWIRALHDGEATAMTTLGAAMRLYHERVIAPCWPAIVAHVEADRAVRARAFLAGGCDGLLGSLRPIARWESPLLEVDYPVEQDLYLGGRGMLLVPSYFCWRMPVALADPTLPPVLVYPVEHPGGARPASGETGDQSLAALLGHTRAAVLRAIDVGCTTTELGRRAGVSLSSASQHASVLRDAGLIATRRQGGAVLHSLTSLGASLLHTAAGERGPGFDHD